MTDRLDVVAARERMNKVLGDLPTHLMVLTQEELATIREALSKNGQEPASTEQEQPAPAIAEPADPTPARPKVITEIPEASDSRWKSWAKLVTGVDRNQQNGYAFQGQWLRQGRKAELPVGSIVLFYEETGSRKHHEPSVQVCRLEQNGTFSVVESASGWSWALEIRDKVAELFD